MSLKVVFSGNVNNLVGTLVYDDYTSTYYGCAATLKNEFWYFGGSGDSRPGSGLKRQVMLRGYSKKT